MSSNALLSLPETATQAVNLSRPAANHNTNEKILTSSELQILERNNIIHALGIKREQ